MADMRSIKTRMKSIENIGQITKSLKTVSAAKLRSVQSRLAQTADFTESCRAILSCLMAGGAGVDNAFARPAGGGSVCYVVFLGSRGLCGAYNTALVKYLQQLLAQEKDGAVIAVGHWGKEPLDAAGIHPLRRFEDVSDTPTQPEAAALAEYLKELFLSGTADAVELVYERYDSALSQTPVCRPLLPLRPQPGEKKLNGYIFEPDRLSLVDKLVHLDIDNEVYSVLLEAKKGEHSARMNTMSAAADNTDELLDELLLEMNHVRQTAITTELAEIMGSGCQSGQ